MEKNFEKDSSAIKGLLRDQQRENAEKNRIITKKAKELDDLKMFYNSKLANLEKKYNEELQLHHVKATEAHKLYQDLEASGHSSDMRVQMLVDQLKEKYLVTVSQLESKLRAELDTNQSLLSKQKYVLPIKNCLCVTDTFIFSQTC